VSASTPHPRARTQRLLDGLAGRLQGDPALQARTQAVLQGEIPCPDLEDPDVAKDANALTSMRIPESLLTRADALVPRLEAVREPGLASVSRHQVLVRALARGLDVLEREHGGGRKRK